MKKSDCQIIKSILFVSGAFTFAFLLAETVHEFGHFISHRLYGNRAILIHLDPFGGSRMVGSTALSEIGMIVTSAAGPALNLVVALSCMFLLWRAKKPGLLPLLIWALTALIQEGVNLSLGLLSTNSDAQWIARSGLPTPIILMVGVSLLLIGLILISALLPLAGISPDAPFRFTLLIAFMGFCSLLLIRLAGTAFYNPEEVSQNLIPLAFSGILASIVAVLKKPVARIIPEISSQEITKVTWNTVGSSLVFGTGMFLFQLIS